MDCVLRDPSTSVHVLPSPPQTAHLSNRLSDSIRRSQPIGYTNKTSTVSSSNKPSARFACVFLLFVAQNHHIASPTLWSKTFAANRSVNTTLWQFQQFHCRHRSNNVQHKNRNLCKRVFLRNWFLKSAKGLRVCRPRENFWNLICKSVHFRTFDCKKNFYAYPTCF